MKTTRFNKMFKVVGINHNIQNDAFSCGVHVIEV